MLNKLAPKKCTQSTYRLWQYLTFVQTMLWDIRSFP